MKICTVYRSSKVDEMYLYVERSVGLEQVPEPLMERFGEAQEVMVLPLRPERKLARVDTHKVLAGIDETGYYLQMPPPKPPPPFAHVDADEFKVRRKARHSSVSAERDARGGEAGRSDQENAGDVDQ